MPVTNEQVNTVAGAIVREIPASHIVTFLNKFHVAAKGGSCGAGCGDGCCGAACAVANPESIDTIDPYGHIGLSSAVLNEIGTSRLADLKAAVKAQLSSVGGGL